ncbi:Stk1 family PASTA domain-containing Ser/Thr kinase [Luedemannella helvata]|uniref:non-specific serine/threonine protein kinase n=1 Tax=Luedemannella helvata TaxID=349315 RepID=A0ABN2KGX3_9ACTN
MTAQAPLLGGRYQVGELLGYGGMAEVRRGRDLRLGRDVAIKLLRADLARDDTFQMRFRREAQNAAALNHPAIVAVYDTGEERGPAGESLPYIVMEYVNGRTLKEVLAAEGRLQPRRALELTAEICAALEFSHRHGIIHRDIKPGNVMLTQTGQVKVMDFGIARALASGASTMTQTSAVIGTAQYLSPEQARGEAVDARSDVYATGCVLFELMTGHPPFIGDSPVSVAYQHVREDPKPPSLSNRDVPPAVDAIVLKALTKNPVNRYQSAAEMRADVLRAAQGRPVHAEPVLPMDEAGPTQVLRSPTGTTRQIPAGVGNTRRRKTSGWAIAALTTLGVLAVIALTAGLIIMNLPKKAVVPTVTGLSVEEATTRLNAAGLTAKPEPRTGTDCPRGEVIGQNPQPNQRVEQKSEVVITWCAGPNQVKVPSLVGTSKGNAEEQLKGAGLVPKWKQVDSERPKDEVVRTNPKSGTELPEGSTVEVEISRENMKKVDDVAGRSEEAARAILTNANFQVRVADRLTTDESQVGIVMSQDPDGGTVLKTGSTITLYVGVLQEPTTAPPTTAPPTSAPPT